MKAIKCVIWDLDNTIWDGILLEDQLISLKEHVLETIETLDKRGILQSIASKNSYIQAEGALRQLGIYDYFLCPEISWNAKSDSIKKIINTLNIGVDSVAFVDDQHYELDEVKYELPEINVIHTAEIQNILAMPEMMPKYITEDSMQRRSLYQSDMKRRGDEEVFSGPHEEFLATLNMQLTISPLNEGDLQRAAELTMRTHQLNTTGYSYSAEELKIMIKSEKYVVLIVGLDDKYGSYGKIGLILLERSINEWNIKLLLMSCRVMTRGIGSILINYLLEKARISGVKLFAEYVPNEKNRMMYVTYKFSGFQEVDSREALMVLENKFQYVQHVPGYVTIHDSMMKGYLCENE